MSSKACSDEEFINLVNTHGVTKAAQILGVNARTAQRRRISIEERRDIIIGKQYKVGSYDARIPYNLMNGMILVGSDAHYWPDEITTAHKAFVHLAKELTPDLIIMNGDVFDGARISRHPPIGYSEKPSVKQELETVDERLTEIHESCKSAKKLWICGNHDMRFENRLANDAAHYQGVKGFTLQDHFPAWQFGISTWVNNQVVVKHRYKGGVHATHNNTVSAGLSIITGHLHSLKVTPYADYTGNRFGVDTGTLAEPYGPQFDYCEDGPQNWRSGFVVLTFHNGKLLWPEVVHVTAHGQFQFRGKVYTVK